MTRVAIVNIATGIVENVGVMGENLPQNASQPTTPPDGYLWIDSADAAIGWTYANGVLVAPPSPPVVPQPDVTGFINSAKAGLGGIVALANLFGAKASLVYDALQSSQWADATALIVDAHSSGTMTDAQYSSLKSLASSYFVPLSLP